jgi:hypothetical protein
METRTKNILSDRIIEQKSNLIQAQMDFTHGPAAIRTATHFISFLKPADFKDQYIPPLASHLQPQLDAYIQLVEQLNQELKRIPQTLSVIVPKCRSDQDIRDALPDFFTEMHPELSKLPRTRSMSFLQDQNPIQAKRIREAQEAPFSVAIHAFLE